MKGNTWQFALGVAVTIVAAGCNVGMAPEGPSEADVRARAAKLPVAEQIQLIQGSGMPQAEKERRIKELQEKNGITPEASPSASEGGPPPR